MDEETKNPSIYDKEDIEKRKYILSTIKEYGFIDSKMHIKWSHKPNNGASLELDLSSGKVNYYLTEDGTGIYKGEFFEEEQKVITDK